ARAQQTRSVAFEKAAGIRSGKDIPADALLGRLAQITLDGPTDRIAIYGQQMTQRADTDQSLVDAGRPPFSLRDAGTTNLIGDRQNISGGRAHGGYDTPVLLLAESYSVAKPNAALREPT